MYHYEEYIKFKERYINNIKSIKEIVKYPKISIADKPNIELKQSVSSYELIFDRVGRLLLVQKLNSNYSYVYSYNEKQLESIEELCNGRVTMINKINYDNSSRIIEEDIQETFQDKDSRIENLSYKYINGNTVIINKVTTMDDADFIATETYNDKRQLISQKLEDEKEVIYFDFFEYDLNGFKTKQIMANADGSYDLNDIRKYNYNGKGLIISEDGIITYEYKYNSLGDWIERIRYKEGILQYVTHRQLEYY
ncbi:hypothetical protein [uncultured Tenacibaculum sp.]|uniref:hypothetical protein n=1 Tax=uncultured Tenacibaculum sp. TaxID=174713 RepID=UPI002629E51A|nr:hypothetical protein [uncultured Tenacibaculum sp.]